MVHFFEGVGFGVSHNLAPGIFYFVLVVFYITTLILPRSLILRSQIFNQPTLGILYFNHPDVHAQCNTTAIFYKPTLTECKVLSADGQHGAQPEYTQGNSVLPCPALWL